MWERLGKIGQSCAKLVTFDRISSVLMAFARFDSFLMLGDSFDAGVKLSQV